MSILPFFIDHEDMAVSIPSQKWKISPMNQMAFVLFRNRHHGCNPDDSVADEW